MNLAFYIISITRSNTKLNNPGDNLSVCPKNPTVILYQKLHIVSKRTSLFKQNTFWAPCIKFVTVLPSLVLLKY